MILSYNGCRLSEALTLTGDWVRLSTGTVAFKSLKRRLDGLYRIAPVPLPCSTQSTWCM